MPAIVFPLGAQHGRIIRATVIKDDDAQLSGFVFYLDSYAFGVRMAESIDYGFATDAVNFITYDRVDGTRSPLNRDTKINFLFEGKFLPDARECLFDINRVGS